MRLPSVVLCLIFSFLLKNSVPQPRSPYSWIPVQTWLPSAVQAGRIWGDCAMHVILTVSKCLRQIPRFSRHRLPLPKNRWCCGGRRPRHEYIFLFLSKLISELMKTRRYALINHHFSKAHIPPFSPRSSQEEFNGKPDSLYFTDGQRRIDFVLVYEDETKKETNKKGTNEKQRVGSLFCCNFIYSLLYCEMRKGVWFLCKPLRKLTWWTTNQTSIPCFLRPCSFKACEQEILLNFSQVCSGSSSVVSGWRESHSSGAGFSVV